MVAVNPVDILPLFINSSVK